MSDPSRVSSAAAAANAQLGGIRPPDAAPASSPREQGKQFAAVPAKVAKKPEEGTEPAEKVKKKKPVKPILLVVVALLAGYVVKGKAVKPHYGPGATVPKGAIIDLPSVTTNLSDGHLAQIGVSLQMSAPGSAKEVAKDTSELLSATVAAVGAQSYSTLLPASGRAALQAQLLRTYQVDLGTSEGAQQVSQVYFTSFVLQ